MVCFKKSWNWAKMLEGLNENLRNEVLIMGDTSLAKIGEKLDFQTIQKQESQSCDEFKKLVFNRTWVFKSRLNVKENKLYFRMSNKISFVQLPKMNPTRKTDETDKQERRMKTKHFSGYGNRLRSIWKTLNENENKVKKKWKT